MIGPGEFVDVLVPNGLIADYMRTSEQSECPVVDRICWIDYVDGVVGLIEVTDEKANPRIARLIDLLAGLQNKTLRRLDTDEWCPPILANPGNENKRSKEAEAEWQRAVVRYKKIENLVKNFERDLFIPKSRGKLLNALRKEGSITRPTAMVSIRQYYRCGMTINALVTNHYKCGGPGSTRTPGSKKRGRPPLPKNRLPDKPGVNVDDATRSYLIQGWKQFRVIERRSIYKAYRATLSRYFATGYRLVAGIVQPILPPVDELPTIDQFKYWGTKERNTRLDKALQSSDRQFALLHREIGGSARALVHGPGDEFQMDATNGLIHLIARENPTVRIGKGICYGVMDTYSQFVVGWCLVLENASYAALAIALERSFTDKTEYCRCRGIEITPEDWPAHIVPSSVLGDRGPELLGHQGDNMVDALSFRFSSTPTGRADWKAFIERIFGDLKDELDTVPGATRRQKQRCEKNPADDACITLDEMEQLLIAYIMKFNHTHIVTNHPDAIYLMAEGLAPTPFNLWNWGRANRSGIGRRFDREYIRAAVLPKAVVPATGEGLAFEGLAYSSASLSEAGAFLRDTGYRRQKFTIAYDPRNLSEVWLLDSRGRFVEACPLAPKYQHYRGYTLWELEALREQTTPITISANTRKLEFECGFDALKQTVVETAKARQAEFGIQRVKYDAEARKDEQDKRRKESAWTKPATTGSTQDPVSYQYVEPPEYCDLESNEEDP